MHLYSVKCSVIASFLGSSIRIFSISFVPPAESGCSVSAEHLLHSELKSAAGCDWTGRGRKGQLHTHVNTSESESSSMWHHIVLAATSSCVTFLCVSTSVQSSLLSSILGELSAEKGVLKVKGQLTYAAQQPWVFPGTIRSNILFGKELNNQKYEQVIRACALKRVRD